MIKFTSNNFFKSSFFKLLIAFFITLIIWLIPHPSNMSIFAWRAFAVFLGTIIACILQALPLGALALIGLTLYILSDTITRISFNSQSLNDAMKESTQSALTGFNNSVVWLVVIAFFISRGIIKSGLGNRIAFLFVKKFGKKTLGLSYALAFCDLIISPATPSNTARGGGIIFPIVKSLAESYDSTPQKKTERKIGSYLIFTAFHVNIITSALFLTSMSVNITIQGLLIKDFNFNLTWINWFLGASIPAIISFILVPLIIYKIYPPEIKETPKAAEWANQKLNEMGSLKKNEILMIIIFCIALLLWFLGSILNINATFTAMVALSLLLLTKVLTWDDVKKESGAWDTLMWFAILIYLAGTLKSTGFINSLVNAIKPTLVSLPWVITFILIILFYFYSHYLFASANAHALAMFTAIVTIATTSGAPLMLTALAIGFASNYFASTTNYSNGPCPIFFGSKYVDQKTWYKLNAIMGIFYLIVWGIVGSLWLSLIFH